MFTTKITPSETCERVKSGTRDNSSTNHTERFHQAENPLLSITVNTDAYLYLLKWLPLKDLHSMMLVSKTFMTVFRDPQIYNPLKSFIYLTNQGNLRELDERYETELAARPQADYYDHRYKFTCCQTALSPFVFCCRVSRSEPSNLDNVEQQFPQQRKCFDFYWLTFITLSFLATFIIDTGPDVKNKEYASYLRNKYKQMGFTKVTLEDILFPDISHSMYSILIASAFFMVIACSGYTTCIKPWMYYRKKLASLEDIQRNKITVKNRDKMFNTMTVISPETEVIELKETEEMRPEAGQLRRRITSIRP